MLRCSFYSFPIHRIVRILSMWSRIMEIIIPEQAAMLTSFSLLWFRIVSPSLCTADLFASIQTTNPLLLIPPPAIIYRILPQLAFESVIRTQ